MGYEDRILISVLNGCVFPTTPLCVQYVWLPVLLETGVGYPVTHGVMEEGHVGMVDGVWVYHSTILR